MTTPYDTKKAPYRPFLSVRSDGVQQYRRWEKAADREGLMLSQWVRKALDSAARDRESTKKERV